MDTISVMVTIGKALCASTEHTGRHPCMVRFFGSFLGSSVCRALAGSFSMGMCTYGNYRM